MANYSYKFPDQVNVQGFGITFQATNKAPLELNRIFETLEKAQEYIDDTDEKAIPGLNLSVIKDGDNNGVYNVIEKEGTPNGLALLKLATTDDIESDLSKIYSSIGITSEDSNITKYVSGNTYASGSTSVIEAINKLGSATTKSNVTAATWNDIAANIKHEEKGTTITFSGLTGSNAKVSSAYTSISYPEDFDSKVTDYKIASTDSIDSAFTKVEKTISALTQEMLDNEEVTEKAIEKIIESAGFSSEPIGYSVDKTCKTIGSSKNVVDALEKLDKELNSRKRITSTSNEFQTIGDDGKLKLQFNGSISDGNITTATTENMHKNIITSNDNGVYAIADLHYNATTNKLSWINTNGTREIDLSNAGASGIETFEYVDTDEHPESLHIVYYTHDGGTGETYCSLHNVVMENLPMVSGKTYTETDGAKTYSSATDSGTSWSGTTNVSLILKHNEKGASELAADITIFDCGTY